MSFENFLQVPPIMTIRPSRKNCSPKITADVKKQASPLMNKAQQSPANSGEKVEQGRDHHFLIRLYNRNLVFRIRHSYIQYTADV